MFFLGANCPTTSRQHLDGLVVQKDRLFCCSKKLARISLARDAAERLEGPTPILLDHDKHVVKELAQNVHQLSVNLIRNTHIPGA